MADDTPFDPRTPFSRAEARLAGLPADNLLSSGYRRLFHDSYVSADVKVTVHLLARAALKIAGPGGRICHSTAAVLLGGCVPDDADVHVAFPPGRHRSRRDGLRSHRVSLGDQVVWHRSLPMSSPTQCVLEMATSLGLVDLVVLGDSLVKAGVVTPGELVDGAEAYTGPGARLARRAMGLVREGVDSPMETRLRLLLVLAGLPEPVVAHELCDDDGRVVVRLDLCWPGWRVAVEYEGRHHAESTTQWQHDITRREVLDHRRVRLVVVRSDGIYADPGATLRRVEQALVDQGVVGVTVRDDTWRRYFPGYRHAA
ncbi:hypothetical protein [Euzebya sp.]|uniref:hypothetical protein n=1 Tax=Euzebya sp. TaxID=1971409 RepID=UPI003517CE38